MAEQSVDIVILRQNAVQEELSREVIEEKIAQIKEEKKKREMEEKEKEKEEVEMS